LSVTYIGPKSRTERPRKNKIVSEVAQPIGVRYIVPPISTPLGSMTDTTFKVKGQGHQAALLTAVLMRQTAAVVTVGTYWPWKTTATLRSAGAAVGWVSQGTSVPTEEGEGLGHIVAAALIQRV